MADDLNKLLMYIVDHPVMQNASREAQIDATAVQDVPQEIKAISQERHEDAKRLSPYFVMGLRMAARNQGRVVVEDTNPEGNSIADVFARYLVAPNLASSQSESLSNSHYRYTFEVNWQALRDLARGAGIDLDTALAAGR
jgi:hypothetical protein